MSSFISISADSLSMECSRNADPTPEAISDFITEYNMAVMTGKTKYTGIVDTLDSVPGARKGLYDTMVASARKRIKQSPLQCSQEMHDLFRAFPDALANTEKVAAMCNVELELGKRHAPVYRVPGGRNADDYLRELVYERAVTKYAELTPED